jgi:Tfp pilus assembly protein PilX
MIAGRNRISKGSGFRPMKGESGVALIMALLMMVILSFMGLSALFTSSDEIILSANYKGGREAFFAADGGVQYVHEDSVYFIESNYAGPGSSFLGGFPRVGISLSNNGTNANGAVTFMASGAPPVGSGTSITTHKADYYTIASTGTGSNGSQQKQAEVMAKILVKGTGS